MEPKHDVRKQEFALQSLPVLVAEAEATGNEPSRQRSILGQCRRRAPLPGTVDLPDHARHYPAWVTTKRDDWCGEHEHTQQG